MHNNHNWYCIVILPDENSDIKKDFEKDPVKAIEKLLGVDLPDDIVEKVIDGVKAKIAVDSVADIAGKLKKFF